MQKFMVWNLNISRFIVRMQKEIPADVVCSVSLGVGFYIILGTVKQNACVQ